MNEEQILIKANEILDETKDEKVKYEIERKIIYGLIKRRTTEDMEILENIEKLFSKIRTLEEEEKKYTEIKLKLNELRNQKTRKSDEDEMIHDFLLKDKNGEYYSFFSRESAKQFFEENKEKFDENVEIQIAKIKSIDLQKLINISI